MVTDKKIFMHNNASSSSSNSEDNKSEGTHWSAVIIKSNEEDLKKELAA